MIQTESGSEKKKPVPSVGNPVLPSSGFPCRSGKVCAAGDDVGEAAGDIHRSQRRDEGRDIELRHQETVHHAYHRTEGEADEDDDPYMIIDRDAEGLQREALADQPAGDHAADSDDRPRIDLCLR